jgi:hypothetical protein
MPGRRTAARREAAMASAEQPPHRPLPQRRRLLPAQAIPTLEEARRERRALTPLRQRQAETSRAPPPPRTRRRRCATRMRARPGLRPPGSHPQTQGVRQPKLVWQRRCRALRPREGKVARSRFPALRPRRKRRRRAAWSHPAERRCPVVRPFPPETRRPDSWQPGQTRPGRQRRGPRSPRALPARLPRWLQPAQGRPRAREARPERAP